MEKLFKDKVALVTGASFGIGRASALAFAKRGAKIILVDWIEDATTAKFIKEIGSESVFIKCDVSKLHDVKSMIEKAVSAYGRIDFAHNNAGVEGIQASTVDCTEENWDRTLAVNLKGIWLCMKFEIPQMLKQGKGAIVNTASIAGLVGSPNLPAYVSSKHAVVGLTKTSALEYAQQKIRINAVCPGVIKTAMIDRLTGFDAEVEKQYVNMEPIGRIGQPEEIAEAVVWLCSDAASFITGHAMAVDGGFVAQ